MKKILIDTVSLMSTVTGIGRYTYEISKHLRDLGDGNYDYTYNYGYHSRDLYAPNTYLQKSKRFYAFFKKIPVFKRFGRKFYLFITRFYTKKYDLYWQPNFIPNKNIKAKKLISTVHDFSFKLQPSWHPRERIDYFNKNFYIIEKSHHIITGSHFTKKEIIKYMQIPEEKVTVIYHGVNHDLYKIYPRSKTVKTKIKFDLSENFLLFVGSIEPRKNLLNLLKAYNLFSNEEKKKLPLMLVGFRGWENTQVMKEIEEAKENIRYIGYVNDEELAHIYNLCTIFIYPSLYEGFGLPPLEAMACGAPVIVSNVASLPEVCADAAVYIDPNNPQEIKAAISTLVEDVFAREALSQKAVLQASEFSWHDAASRHLEIFKKIMAV